MSTGTESYYERRADEYDLIYERPERQADLAVLGEQVVSLLAGRSVLEVAAGTGWWTDVYAERASRVLATDFNLATLAVAKARRAWPEFVEFRVADAFALDAAVPASSASPFDAAFAGFFWSHIPRPRLGAFLSGLVSRLQPGSTMVFIDNLFVDDSNLPVTRTDGDGNTYQERVLQDGSRWEVLKNFPTVTEIAHELSPFGGETTVTSLEYYWLATVTTSTA